MKKTKFIFLDRDGVINRYPGDGNYVSTLDEFKIIKGALESIRLLSQAGYRIYVISNQSGVGKGLYSKQVLATITRFLVKEVKKSGGRIHRVLYCTHLPEAQCCCRKPKVGLLRCAVKNSKIDVKNSYFIGDNLIDIKTGKNFSLKTILVLSGLEKLKNASAWKILPDFIAKDLLAATKNIIRNKYERA